MGSRGRHPVEVPGASSIPAQIETMPHELQWDPTKSYDEMEIVSYNGHRYKCLIAHRSQLNRSPAVAVLWEPYGETT